MKKVLYVHPFGRERWNLGDSVYFFGARELITGAIGEHIVIKGVMEKFKTDNNYINTLPNDIDLIVTTGSPWLQSYFDKNWMSGELLKLVLKYSKVPKVALGLGGCSGLNKFYFHRQESLEVTKKIFKSFNLIITRDPLTNQFLHLSRIKAYNLLDTAVFFPMFKFINNLKIKIKDSNKPVMIYFDSKAGISQGDYNKKEHDLINELYIDIYKKYNPTVYVMNEPEVGVAKKYGIDNVKWLWHYRDVLSVLSKASLVISGRVHQATLSVLLNKKTYIIPYDIRYLCCSSIGAIPIFSSETIKDLNKANKPKFQFLLINKTKKHIINLIKQRVKL